MNVLALMHVLVDIGYHCFSIINVSVTATNCFSNKSLLVKFQAHALNFINPIS